MNFLKYIIPSQHQSTKQGLQVAFISFILGIVSAIPISFWSKTTPIVLHELFKNMTMLAIYKTVLYIYALKFIFVIIFKVKIHYIVLISSAVFLSSLAGYGLIKNAYAFYTLALLNVLFIGAQDMVLGAYHLLVIPSASRTWAANFFSVGFKFGLVCSFTPLLFDNRHVIMVVYTVACGIWLKFLLKDKLDLSNYSPPISYIVKVELKQWFLHDKNRYWIILTMLLTNIFSPILDIYLLDNFGISPKKVALVNLSTILGGFILGLLFSKFIQQYRSIYRICMWILVSNLFICLVMLSNNYIIITLTTYLLAPLKLLLIYHLIYMEAERGKYSAITLVNFLWAIYRLCGYILSTLTFTLVRFSSWQTWTLVLLVVHIGLYLLLRKSYVKN